jgi:hypothetical protein
MDHDREAYDAWLMAIRGLTSSAEASRAWREERWRFAHRLGEALVGPTESAPAVSGPALYGIWLPWGLLYVGQTLSASRRLRDLPIGESHHLANTFPPETWDRIAVISWGATPEATEPIARLGEKAVGLSLEYAMQLHARPLANATRRTPLGGWRPVDPLRSNSLGARSVGEIAALVALVKTLWAKASSGEPASPFLRVVNPSQFLDHLIPATRSGRQVVHDDQHGDLDTPTGRDRDTRDRRAGTFGSHDGI